MPDVNVVPLINSDPDLQEKIAGLIRDVLKPEQDLVPLDSRVKAVDYLNTEMPEVVLLNFSDPRVDAFDLLEVVAGDPWLIHGGIVALCADYEATSRLEQFRQVNVIAAIPAGSLERQLPRIMDIIQHNRRILFQREIGADLVRGISGSFKLRNDPLEARCHTNLVCNFLYNSNRLDDDTREGLNLALGEILMNGIEHGNCGISFEEKSAWLEDGGDIADLIARRCEDPEIDRRRVTFEYTITPEASEFLIADEGEGFDWRKVLVPTDEENLLLEHGRGIMLATALTDRLTYNEPGNEVRFRLPHQSDLVSVTPALLEEIEPEDVGPGDIVFNQGEPGTFLYYIAKGTYEVLVNGQVVATMSPDDIFMGEMSFLLNNRRSATVRAQADGRLIKISKSDFVEAIKNKPHYALFLSRLLAQRVVRANLRTVGEA